MSTYLFAIWIFLAAGLLLMFLYAAFVNLRRSHVSEVGLDEVIPYLLPVNIETLAEMIAPSREEYSRHTQSAREFRRSQRKRIRLTQEYLRRMSQNAALLQRVGYSQLHSANPLLAEQAQALIDAGVHVRLYTFVGMAVVSFWWTLRLNMLPLFSRTQASGLRELMNSGLIPAYQALRTKAESLTMLNRVGFYDELVHSL